MNLYEFEGKMLLAKAGVRVPKSQILSSPLDPVSIAGPWVVKAQILKTNRQALGGIAIVKNESELRPTIEGFFEKFTDLRNILVEEFIDATGDEYYFSIAYDSYRRAPVILFSSGGGTGVEDRHIDTYELNPLHPTAPDLPIPSDVVKKLIGIFFENDCLVLEINPLVCRREEWIALDAKIKLDEDAAVRHPEWNFLSNIGDRQLTPRERIARQIDAGDYRGTAGRIFIELPGDIAVLASGGGASLVALDALVAAGGEPANYTEYSGNPSRQKVRALTEVVLSRDGLRGIWVVGAIANFTDIYETLAGVIDGFRVVEEKYGKKINVPIVVRRGGPRGEEAFAMLAGITDLNLHVSGEEMSISQSAQKIVELVNAAPR